MSHTSIETTEFQNIKDVLTRLGNGSTICETSKNGNPLRTWIVKDGNLTLDIDWIEQDRKFTKPEEAAFKEKITRGFVANFFVNYQDDDRIPQREYSALCNAEDTFFKHVRHEGSYIVGKPRYNLYNVRINKDQNIVEAVQEVEYIQSLQKKRFKNRKTFEWKIFEHTLSESGIHNLIIHSDGACEISITTYGYTGKPVKFNNLAGAMDYIRKHHWYEENTDANN